MRDSLKRDSVPSLDLNFLTLLGRPLRAFLCRALSPQIGQVRGMATEKQSKFTFLFSAFPHATKMLVPHALFTVRPLSSLQPDRFHEESLQDHQFHEDGFRCEVEG